MRIETSPEDIHGMHAAEGILTTRGGMTSHAAVVARGMGKPCVSGAGTIRVDYGRGHHDSGSPHLQNRGVTHHRRRHRAGDRGCASPRSQPELSGEFSILMEWADAVRTHRRAGQRRGHSEGYNLDT